MSFALIIFVLAFGWAVATDNFSLLNLAFGALVGGVGLFLVRDRVQGPRLWRKAWRLLALMVLFLRELVASAIRVGILVLRPNIRRHIRPVIVAFPLRLTSDGEITLLANMITLTPGTLSVDVSEDRKLLLVHAIDCHDEEALIRDIANGFEARIIEALR
jgi:multicomponent Na+:H+ antiporter subunit E